MSPARRFQAMVVLSALAPVALVVHGLVWGNAGDTLFTTGVYVAAILLPSGLCFLRAHQSPAGGRGWWLIGAGIAVWALSDAAYELVVPATATSPTISDALWLAFYVCVGVGIVMLARDRLGVRGRGPIIDGAITSLAVTSLVAAVVFGPILGALGHDATLASNLFYVVGDLVLLGLCFGVMAAAGRRPDRTWVLLAVALLVDAVADGVYLRNVALGTYTDGSVLDALWPAAALALGVAAWATRPAVAPRGVPGRGSMVVPLGSGTVALGVLVAGRVASVPELAAMLAAATLAAVLVRLALSFAENARLLAASRAEANVDALTGLGNRRALLADLEAAAERRDRCVLMLFDLDGFKRYNDTYGHPAGDALLRRLGEHLIVATTAGGRGRSYRLGGDEFCVLAELGSGGPEAIVAAASAALCEEGEGFTVTSSHGAVLLPDECTDAVDALRIADRRMYAQKRARPGDDAPTRQALLRAMHESHPDLGEHMGDVATLAGDVARALGLAASELDAVVRAAELHDIGKVAIPDVILDKPGPLDAAEWAFIRRHTIIGERILAAAPALAPVARLVRSSHERWDGAGYPDGLAGEAIPLGSRIVLVCDAFAVMTAERPYQRPLPVADAIDELRRCAGSQFDPMVVEAFCRARERREGLRPTRERDAPPPHGAAARARPVA